MAWDWDWGKEQGELLGAGQASKLSDRIRVIIIFFKLL